MQVQHAVRVLRSHVAHLYRVGEREAPDKAAIRRFNPVMLTPWLGLLLPPFALDREDAVLPSVTFTSVFLTPGSSA